MNINELGQEAYEAAKSRGHFQDETGITGYFARIHSDLGRALDADRRGETEVREPGMRPTGPNCHLADAAIRVMTLSQHLGIDLERATLHLLQQDEGNASGEDLEKPAWTHYSHRYGDPSAASFDEMIWDGHQTIAQASEPAVRRILQLEAHGITPAQASGDTQEIMALDMAEILIWILGAGCQRSGAMPKLIETIIAADSSR